MRRSAYILLALLILACGAFTLNAHSLVGHVFCDANANRVIDAADAPVQGALVVVTNFEQTFSNATMTAADGSFSIPLPPNSDLYGDYVDPGSLPEGSTILIPSEFTVFQFSIPIPPDNIVTNDFLLANPACVTGPAETNCSMSGSGVLRVGKGKPLHSFSGTINPGCNGKQPHGGKWTDLDHTNRLRFKSVQIEVLDCGVTNASSGGQGNGTGTGRVNGHLNGNGQAETNSPVASNGHVNGNGQAEINGQVNGNGQAGGSKTTTGFIEFGGMGTLKGVGGNQVDSGLVQFFVRIEDNGKQDRYYLRVFDSSGNTLLLVSADPENPLNIAPVAVSGGNLHVRSCSSTR